MEISSAVGRMYLSLSLTGFNAVQTYLEEEHSFPFQNVQNHEPHLQLPQLMSSLSINCVSHTDQSDAGEAENQMSSFFILQIYLK